MVDRISRDEMLMDTADLQAQRGTCSRLQVGVVFARHGRIISAGYNGAPAGMPHCEHYRWTGHHDVPQWVTDFLISTEYLDDKLLRGTVLSREEGSDKVIASYPDNPANPGCPIAEHAERNAIAFAAKHGVILDKSDMYITHMPCIDCARSVINAGVETVIYREPYRDESGIELLRRAGIRVLEYQDLGA